VEEVVDFEAQEKAAKAARKAEKKAKKLGKAKQEVSDSDTPAAVSNGSSAAASKGQSSATSPEAELDVGNAKYTQDPALSALPQSEVDTYLADNFITVTDPLSSKPTFRPLLKFSYLPIKDKSQLAPFAGFASPTPIQAASWPALLAGRDMIGVAETGSGKTLAFGVPCIRYITSLPKSERKGIQAVIVSPTRELASQIHEQLVKLATPAGLEVVCVYGGVPRDPQIHALKTAHIVVATPGRLNDLVEAKAAPLGKARYVVLDEADRMLDKGFEDAIRQIINCTAPAPARQTLMFTATWPTSVRDLAATFMQTPVKIAIGDNPTGELRANTRIKQVVEVVEPRNKEFRLLQLIKKYQSGADKDDRILIFCLYKKEATRVEGMIRSKGFRVAGIHGDLSQVQRTKSLESFKDGSVPLLVATDVAARGLDIPAVKVVINVTFPLTVEDYVHRIGRTGRAGKEGLAITLFTELDKGLSGA
jgi:ATP-dependent RNA helicase DBP3